MFPLFDFGKKIVDKDNFIFFLSYLLGKIALMILVVDLNYKLLHVV